MAFSNRLISLRRDADLTQSELSSAIGISVTSISLWERGNSKANADQLLKLANFFSVSIDYLLDRNGPADNSLEEDDAEIKKDILTMQRFLRKSSKEKRKNFMTILNIAFQDGFEEDL